MLRNQKYISVKLSKSELTERNEELSFLLDMSNLLTTSMGLEDLLQCALSQILGYFGMEAGRIYLLDDTGQWLQMVAYQGTDPGGLEKLHVKEGFSGKAVRTKSFIAQYVLELEDKKRSTYLLSKGFKIIICAPLITRDKVRGVINLATSEDMIELDENKIDLFAALGSQIANAVDNVRLYEELNNKIQTLKDQQEMIEYFAYSVSHDIRSPVIGIHGLTKRLLDKYSGTLDEKGQVYCDQILRTAEQTVALVERINEYIRTKEAPLSLEKVNIKEVTETIKKEFFPELKLRKIKWSEPEDLPKVIADKLALCRVFRNLVDNALKYGGDEMREVNIGYEETDSFHVLSFGDDGVGITEEGQKKIFELFQRHETSKGKAGTGLGLAVVREVAKRHEGRAWIVSGAHRGKTFYISISKNLNPTS